MIILATIIGFVIGTIFGFMITALAVAAGRCADDKKDKKEHSAGEDT